MPALFYLRFTIHEHMSDPLIARRCPWCGVAIREQAFFCPQCGKDLTQLHPDFSATIVESAPPKIRKSAIGQQALGKMGAGIQKASHVARDVEGNVAHRVQKLRDASSVVLDEASYDASLRFVLIAVLLFIMFLVM